MTKKQILIAIFVSIPLIVLIGGFFGYFLFIKDGGRYKLNSNNANSTSNIKLDPNTATTVPLGQKKSPDNNGLSVDDSSRSSPNLGSGSQISTNIRSNGSSSTTAPSAADLKQYEQYKDSKEVYFGDIVEGNGVVAQKNSQLAVSYKGYLTNGTMFDQSRTGANGQKEPLLFTLGNGQLIVGFEQGVAGMKAGGTRRIIIPPSLGYGDKEQNGIPAGSVLIFDVQLLTVQ